MHNTIFRIFPPISQHHFYIIFANKQTKKALHTHYFAPQTTALSRSWTWAGISNQLKQRTISHWIPLDQSIDAKAKGFGSSKPKLELQWASSKPGVRQNNSTEQNRMEFKQRATYAGDSWCYRQHRVASNASAVSELQAELLLGCINSMLATLLLHSVDDHQRASKSCSDAVLLMTVYLREVLDSSSMLKEHKFVFQLLLVASEQLLQVILVLLTAFFSARFDRSVLCCMYIVATNDRLHCGLVDNADYYILIYWYCKIFFIFILFNYY